MKCARSFILVLIATVLFGNCVACKREERRASESAGLAASDSQGSRPRPPVETASMTIPTAYEESASAVAQGEHLFDAYNCIVCHADGAGGVGPSLSDSNWIYGGGPQQIFSTLMEGRPGGMPSFRGRIPEDQILKIVAYVRSMSGQIDSSRVKVERPKSAKQKLK